MPKTKGPLNLYSTVYGVKGIIYLASYAALSLGVGIGLTYLRSYNNGFRTEAFTCLKNGDLLSYQKTKNISILMDILDPLIIRVMFSIQGYFREWLFNHLFERLCDPKNFQVIREFEEKSKKMIYSSDLLNGARSSMAVVHKTIFGGMGILQSYMTVSTIFAASTGIRVEIQVAVVFGLLMFNFVMGYYNSKFANEANIKESELLQKQEALLKDLRVSPHEIMKRRDDLTAVNSEIIACKDVQDYSKMINPELIGSVFWGASEAVLVNMLDPNNAVLGMVYMSNLSVLNEMLRKLVRCGYEVSDGFGIFRRLIDNDLPIYRKIVESEREANRREMFEKGGVVVNLSDIVRAAAAAAAAAAPAPAPKPASTPAEVKAVSTEAGSPVVEPAAVAPIEAVSPVAAAAPAEVKAVSTEAGSPAVEPAAVAPIEAVSPVAAAPAEVKAVSTEAGSPVVEPAAVAPIEAVSPVAAAAPAEVKAVSTEASSAAAAGALYPAPTPESGEVLKPGQRVCVLTGIMPTERSEEEAKKLRKLQEQAALTFREFVEIRDAVMRYKGGAIDPTGPLTYGPSLPPSEVGGAARVAAAATSTSTSTSTSLSTAASAPTSPSVDKAPTKASPGLRLRTVGRGSGGHPPEADERGR